MKKYALASNRQKNQKKIQKFFIFPLDISRYVMYITGITSKRAGCPERKNKMKSKTEEWIEKRIEQNAAITKDSLILAAEGIQAIIQGIEVMSVVDLIEQIDSNMAFLVNAQAAIQRNKALEQTLVMNQKLKINKPAAN